MITIFSMLTRACGISRDEAADMLNVRLKTVDAWITGRQEPPTKVLDELITLAGRIERAASEAILQIEMLIDQHGEPNQIDLGLATDDAEARTIGWPCVGAQTTSLALTVSKGMKRGYNFRILPRGSTAVLAAAADVNEEALAAL